MNLRDEDRDRDARTSRRRGGAEGIDDDLVRAGFKRVGATMMARNRFGPVRGPRAGSDWIGWRGSDPPFFHPVLVLNHPRRPLVFGETTFIFVTEGIALALERAVDTAGDADVRIGGGAATIRQYLGAGLLGELHLAVVPTLLGTGEPLFRDLEELGSTYRCEAPAPSGSVTYYHLRRVADR